MKRLAHMNVGVIIALAVAIYVTYYLLLQDTFLHASISDIINRSHQLKSQKHLLVLGLLPIYIGTMVFGSAVLSIYLGAAIQRLIINKDRKNPIQYKTQMKI